MRKKRPALSGIAMALLALFVGGGAAAFQGEPDGYNGISWGTPLAGLESMEYAGTAKDLPDTLLFRRAGDDLAFGKARLSAINYGFSAGRLTVVTLKVDSLLQYLLMKEEAMRRFGPGREMDPSAERFVWEGDRARIRLISAFDLS